MSWFSCSYLLLFFTPVLLLEMALSTNANVICLCLCLLHRLILEKEGPRSLFRGLGPNLVGVAPSR